MASGHIFLDGLDDIIADFDRVVDDIEKEAVFALDETLLKIELQMKSNAQSTFTDGYTQGVMVNSISHTVSVKNGFITATVGVYDMSNKTGSSDRLISGRHISEPLIAFFYETGIRPHSTSSGARLAHPSRGKEKGQTGKLHQGSPPKPFLTNAFDSFSSEIFENVKDKLNKSIDKK